MSLILATLTIAETPRQKANDLVSRASNAHKEERFEEAASLYLEAHQFAKDAGLGDKPDLLFNAGLAYERSGACERVIELFEQYFALKPSAVTPELSERLASAKDCAPEVTVRSTPSGARVVIDAKDAGVTPAMLRLRAGKHTIKVELDAQMIESEVDVVAGTPTVIERRLDSGELVLRLPPGAAAFIDGAGVFAADRPNTLSVGKHELRIWRDGCEYVVLEFEVDAGLEPTVFAPSLWCTPIARPVLVAKPIAKAKSEVPLWVSGGAGAAGLVSGIVLAVLSTQAVGRQDQERQKAPEAINSAIVRDAQSDAVSYAVGANISIGVALIGALTTGYLLYFDEGE